MRAAGWLRLKLISSTLLTGATPRRGWGLFPEGVLGGAAVAFALGSAARRRTLVAASPPASPAVLALSVLEGTGAASLFFPRPLPWFLVRRFPRARLLTETSILTRRGRRPSFRPLPRPLPRAHLTRRPAQRALLLNRTLTWTIECGPFRDFGVALEPLARRQRRSPRRVPSGRLRCLPGQRAACAFLSFPRRRVRRRGRLP